MNKKTFFTALLITPLLFSCDDHYNACATKWEVFSKAHFSDYQACIEKKKDGESRESFFLDYRPYSVFDGYDMELCAQGVCCHYLKHREKNIYCEEFDCPAEVLFANDPVSSFLVEISFHYSEATAENLVPVFTDKVKFFYSEMSSDEFYNNISYYPKSLGRFLKSSYYEDTDISEYCYSVKNAKHEKLATIVFSQGMSAEKISSILSGVIDALKDTAEKLIAK